MKKFFPDEKVNNEKAPVRIEPDTSSPGNTDSLVKNIFCIHLLRMIKKDRKFFNISAKQSISSN